MKGRKLLKRALMVAGSIFFLALAAFFLVLPPIADQRVNAIRGAVPPAASERAKNLHQTLLIVDLHADTLLWSRDVLVRHSRGHVDVPRLIEGNVALQAFTIVTKTPWGLNIERNSDDSDMITIVAIAELWPVRSWRSLKERTLYQAARLAE